MALSIDRITDVDSSGNVYYRIPKTPTLPAEEAKYISTTWSYDRYSVFTLAYLVYGDPQAYWIILNANKKRNPYDFSDGEKIKILMPKYVSEIT